MSSEQIIDWLRLIRSEQVGPRMFHSLLALHGSATAALSALPEMAMRGGRIKPLRIYSKAQAELELTKMKQCGASIMLSCDDAYPNMLRDLVDFPPVLTYLGRLDLCTSPILAMVGARNASLNGCLIAQELAKSVGHLGAVIASGLARGIDTAAHQASMKSGTIAVVAGGINRIYPPENESLFSRVKEEGLILAEMPYNTPPIAHLFPRRNRIIAALALAVLVVEATRKSGSLITAQIALDLGREVLAVPGSPSDARAKGTNYLIKQGAQLVEKAEDIEEVFAFEAQKKLKFAEKKPLRYVQTTIPKIPSDDELHEARKTIKNMLSPSFVSLDDLIAHTAIPVPVLLTILTELELAGAVIRSAQGKVALSVTSDE